METAEVLVQLVGNRSEVQQGPRRPSIPVEKQILIFLWYLGHKDPYYESGGTFSVAPSAAFNSEPSMVNNYRNELIKWPSGQTLT